MLLVLHIIGKVSDEDILIAADVFDRFDATGCKKGVISLADMQKHVLQAHEHYQQ